MSILIISKTGKTIECSGRFDLLQTLVDANLQSNGIKKDDVEWTICVDPRLAPSDMLSEETFRQDFLEILKRRLLLISNLPRRTDTCREMVKTNKKIIENTISGKEYKYIMYFSFYLVGVFP